MFLERGFVFSDVLDHVVHVDAMGSGLIHVFRTALEASNLLEQQRQSEITRQVAVWGGIVAVPSAIAGIYGMNFANLQGTQTSRGYWPVLALMAALSGLLYWRFRKLGWLRSGRRASTLLRCNPRSQPRASPKREQPGSSERQWFAHPRGQWTS